MIRSPYLSPHKLGDRRWTLINADALPAAMSPPINHHIPSAFIRVHQRFSLLSPFSP